MPAKTLLIAGASIIAAFAAEQPALAQSAPTAPNAPAARGVPGGLGGVVAFNLIDKNGDGYVDKTEADALFTAMFDAVDRDGDGKLSKTEIGAAMMRMHFGAQQRHVGPGTVQRGGPRSDDHRSAGPTVRRGPQQQFDGRNGPEFRQRGDHHSGPAQFRHYRGQPQGTPPQAGPQGTPPAVPPQAGPQGGPPANPPASGATNTPPAQQQGANLQQRLQQRFSTFDTNGDGVISEDEFAAAVQRVPRAR